MGRNWEECLITITLLFCLQECFTLVPFTLERMRRQTLHHAYIQSSPFFWNKISTNVDYCFLIILILLVMRPRKKNKIFFKALWQNESTWQFFHSCSNQSRLVGKAREIILIQEWKKKIWLQIFLLPTFISTGDFLDFFFWVT